MNVNTNPFNLPEATLQRLVRWRVSTFWVALVGYIGYYICRANLSAAFPLMSDAFGFSNAELGLIALYSEVSYAIGKFINGPLGDKIGGKKIFLIGLLGAIISNFVFAFGSHLLYFIVVWAICRYFLSMGWGGLAKMMGNWYEPERNGVIMGWISLNFQFGGVVATLFAGLIVSLGGSWRDVFIYPPLVGLIILIFSWLGAKDSPQDVVPGTRFGTSPHGRESIAKAAISSGDQKSDVVRILSGLLKLPLFRQLLVFSFLTTFLRSIFFFWTPKFLVDIGLGNATGIFMSALFPLLGCVGTVLLGWYTDKYANNGDRARMMWVMLLMLCGTLVTMSFLIGAKGATDLPYSAIVILMGLCGFFLLGPYSMSSGALTLDIAGGEAAGTCTGMIDGLGYLGGALAVWLAGRLSDQLGWGQVFLLLALMALFSTLAAYLMSREFQRRAQANSLKD
jgi:sugar phosphate permease